VARIHVLIVPTGGPGKDRGQVAPGDGKVNSRQRPGSGGPPPEARSAGRESVRQIRL
jgi:hypothetical protein